MGLPNPAYYGGIEYQDNHTLAAFGESNNLPCGGFWIMGNDFAFCLDFGAGTYEHFSHVSEFNHRNTPKWDELRIHLAITENIWNTTKNRNEVAANLGLEPN